VPAKVVRLLIVALPVFVLAGGVTLSLLGYGAAIAIETTFGIPRELTYNSPIGILNLSSHAIGGWIDFLDPFLESEKFKDLVLQMTGAGIVLSALLLGYRFCKVRGNGLGRRSRRARGISQSGPVKFLGRVGRWLFQEKLYLLPFLACATAPWLIVAVLTVLSTTFAIFPLIGHELAARYFHSWIVSADYCVPLSNRDERLREKLPESESVNSSKVKVTTCLSLWKDDIFVAEGRHVASTDKNIILFDPISGDVRIEPMEGISVRMSGLSATKLKKLIEERKLFEKDNKAPD
jgi:hypothetical protein